MDRIGRPRQALAISLAGTAGFVDAVGFVSGGGYFVSFMSGNTTRLGVDLAHDARLAAVPAALIASFVAGVTAGQMLGARAGHRRKTAVLLLVAALLAAAGGLGMAGAGRPPLMLTMLMLPTLMLPTLMLVALAMGAMNMTFQREGQAALGLTYMTGALVKTGQAIGAALGGQRQTGWAGYAALWAALAGGAILGARAYAAFGPAVLLGAAGWAALMALAALRLPPAEAGPQGRPDGLPKA